MRRHSGTVLITVASQQEQLDGKETAGNTSEVTGIKE